MPFSKERDIPIVISKTFIGMSTHLNHIQHNAAPNIQSKANQHIPAGITHALRKAFSITPPSDRTRLYHKIAQLFHTDHLETRSLDLSKPEHAFLNSYLKWIGQTEERNHLKSELMRLLNEVKNEYESDFDYKIYYKNQYFSLNEKAHLNVLHYEQSYPKPINTSLRYIKIFCQIVACLAFMITVLMIAIILPTWVLAKVTPTLPNQLQNYLYAQTAYLFDCYISIHFSSIYVLMLGEKIYKKTLQKTISEQELAEYFRLKYASEVDLSEETNERVFAYSKAAQLDAYCDWDDYDIQTKKSPFIKNLQQLYDMDNFLLLEQYLKNFSPGRHAKFLVLAMYKTFITPLPSRHIAWTTHQKTTNTYQYIFYSKKTSRIHNISQLYEETKTSVTFEPWKETNRSNTIHVLDNALYSRSPDEHKIQKLNYYSEELATLPENIVRTIDSLFMLTGNQLIRLDLDSPSGTYPQSQYILMQNKLFFYDSMRNTCSIIDDGNQNYITKFPIGTQIAALSKEEMQFISRQKPHAIRSWYWNLLQSSLVLILRTLFFIPFLILDIGARLLMKFIPQKIQPRDVLAVTNYAVTSFFKLPLEIYHYLQAPEPRHNLEPQVG